MLLLEFLSSTLPHDQGPFASLTELVFGSAVSTMELGDVFEAAKLDFNLRIVESPPLRNRDLDTVTVFLAFTAAI